MPFKSCILIFWFCKQNLFWNLILFSFVFTDCISSSLATIFFTWEQFATKEKDLQLYFTFLSTVPLLGCFCTMTNFRIGGLTGTFSTPSQIFPLLSEFVLSMKISLTEKSKYLLILIEIQVTSSVIEIQVTFYSYRNLTVEQTQKESNQLG